MVCNSKFSQLLDKANTSVYGDSFFADNINLSSKCQSPKQL